MSLALLLATCVAASTPLPDQPAENALADTLGCTVPSVREAEAVLWRSDLPYRVVGADTLRLDLALAPGDGGPRPLVVIVHGGGWRGGNKSDRLAPVVRRLAASGYAVASVGYRLTTSPATRFPAALEDVWCAIVHLSEHAERYGVDASRIAVIGESAGSQMAALVAYAPAVASGGCRRPELASNLRAMVGMFGIYDVLGFADDARLTGVLENYLGVDPQRDSALARRASPTTYASRRPVPSLLVHGTADRSVPLAQSHQLRSVLEGAGGTAQVVEVRGADHGFPMLSDDPSLRESSCALLAFLRRHLPQREQSVQPVQRVTPLNADRPVQQGQNYRILAHDFALTLPAQVPAGLVRMRLINNGSEPHYMAIMRADSGKGVREFLDWRASRTPRPGWLTPVGGHGAIAAGDSLGLALHLAPGRYVVWCGYPSPDGVSHVAKGMIGEILVEDVAASPVPDPTADVTVRLTDYGISAPVGVRSGRQTLRFVNEASQLHQVLVVRLPDGVTPEQDMAWFKAGARGARPGVPFGGLVQLPGNGTAWASMTFLPGRYMLICAIGDRAGRQHHELGMFTTFEVR